MKYLLATTALLLVAGTVFAQQTPVGERPSWTQSDTWTWSDPAVHQLKHTVLAVAQDYYVAEIVAGSQRSTSTVDRDLHPKGNIVMQFQWPLSLDTNWKRTLTGAAPDGSTGPWEITSVVEASETVAIPAGSFDTFRIKGRHCNTKNNACGDFLMWYAPSAKFYVKFSWGTGYWPAAYRGASRVLTSYQVHSP